MSLNTKKTINNKNYKKCNFCKKLGHLEKDCFNKNPNLIPKNNTKSTKKINLVEEIVEKEELVLTTKESTSNNTIDFILDSGATIHTCYIKELFTSIKPTKTTIK